MGRDEDWGKTNNIAVLNTKLEEKQLNEGQVYPKSLQLVFYLNYNFVGKNKNRTSSEGRFQNPNQTAIERIDNSVKTESGKSIQQKIISGQLFQTAKKSRSDTDLIRGEITPKNRHCLR